MNFLIIFIVTAILQLFAPWWTVALIPFLIMLWRPLTPLHAFVTGFLAIALLWFFYGLYLHTSTTGAMSNRIAEIFSLPNGILLLVVTTIVGGIIGGLSGLSGYFLRKTVQ
ncbi:hypothetical protein SAMN04487995_3341 [Dyadobacter koreensis]|uniref:Uncharacterized protein n=1 Tax=Dyadobacter koreensis TaxID=408657 RepID=A0A1H6WE80_9BACT|nr:hypothetical protein [Dyadobacter koreensis]SEJ12407.1 hypothetical protein SAMN04487995_3341 [Dyadobacter koreensis]